MNRTWDVDGWIAGPPDPARRLRRIDALTGVGAAGLPVEDMLGSALRELRDLLAVDTGSVLLLDPSGSHLVAMAALGLEEETRRGVRIPVGRAFAGAMAAERRPMAIIHVDHDDVLDPILCEKGVRSLLGVPLVADEEILGVLHVGTLVPRLFTHDDADLLQAAADRVAAALRARLTAADPVPGAALQRSIALPDVAGFDLAARYVPGHGPAAGGDWYDAFPLPSGRTCLVVGHVTGAAGDTARLRGALRAHASGTDDPAEVLRRLDDQVRRLEPDTTAAVLCAVVDPLLCTVRVSSAGHPAPVLGTPGRPGELLDVPAYPRIGLGGGTPRRPVTVGLPAGGGLVLWTEGLARGERPGPGAARVASVVRAGPAEAVCRSVMGRLIGSDRIVDDVALLVVVRCEDLFLHRR